MEEQAIQEKDKNISNSCMIGMFFFIVCIVLFILWFMMPEYRNTISAIVLLLLLYYFSRFCFSLFSVRRIPRYYQDIASIKEGRVVIRGKLVTPNYLTTSSSKERCIGYS